MTRARYVSNPQAIDIPLTVSANLTANAVITVGNSSVNSVITSNTYSVGSNVSLSTSRLFLGNSTVNSVHTASTLDVGANVNLSTVGLNVGSNTVNAYINSTSFAIGNSTVNTAITSTTITSTALLSIGNTNVTGTANVSTGINVGANVNLGTSFMDVGNSTVNTTITNITVSTNTVNVASIINVGANVNLSTSQINVGNSTVNTTISATALTTTSNTVSIGTAAYFVANGNVGIGTNSPTVKLQINQSSSTVGLRILSTNATSQNTLQMFHDDSKAVIEASYLASGAFKDIVMQSQGGNLLVNGTSQSGTANKVAVFSANKFGLSIIDTTAQATGVGGALNLGGNYRTSGDAQAFARVAAVKENSTDGNFAYGMTFSTTPNGGSFVEAGRFDSSGNLLVGATSGAGKVYVESTTGNHITLRNPSGSSYTSLRLYNDTNLALRALEIDYYGSTASGGERAEIFCTGAYPLAFGTSNTERFRFLSDGSGYWFPNSDGGGSNTYQLGKAIASFYMGDGNGVVTASIKMARFGGTGGGVTSGAGWVISTGLNTYTPYGAYSDEPTVKISGYAFELIRGNLYSINSYSATVGATNRDLYIDNTGIIGYVSSTRESKTNITSQSDVSWLLALEPVQFNRRKKEKINKHDAPTVEEYSDDYYEEVEYGLIAEDVESINKNLCFYDVEDDQKVLRGVHYSKLATPLLKLVQIQNEAIQEQQALIAQLQADVAELKLNK